MSLSNEELLKIPDSDLSAGLFYKKYKIIQTQSGIRGSGVNMSPADELYNLYVYYSNEKGKPLSGNLFVKAVRSEGTRLSNERAKVLATEFAIKYIEEKEDAK